MKSWLKKPKVVNTQMKSLTEYIHFLAMLSVERAKRQVQIWIMLADSLYSSPEKVHFDNMFREPSKLHDQVMFKFLIKNSPWNWLNCVLLSKNMATKTPDRLASFSPLHVYIPPSNPCYLLFGFVGLYLECDLYIQRVVHATHDALWEEPSNLASFANQMNGEDQLSRILQLTEGRVITSYWTRKKRVVGTFAKFKVNSLGRG